MSGRVKGGCLLSCPSSLQQLTYPQIWLSQWQTKLYSQGAVRESCHCKIGICHLLGQDWFERVSFGPQVQTSLTSVGCQGAVNKF